MVTLGIDEVGRGCLAGPLVVGTVILNANIPGLKDSKLLSKAQRKIMLQEIKLLSLDYSLGWVSAAEIDLMGLTKAMELAIRRALTGITKDYDEIIIDGNINYLKGHPKSRCLIKADNLIPAVSAASVLAKCARDEYMQKQALIYPTYGFDKHVGYGTKLHLRALKQIGKCDLHRMSFQPLIDLGLS